MPHTSGTPLGRGGQPHAAWTLPLHRAERLVPDWTPHLGPSPAWWRGPPCFLPAQQGPIPLSVGPT